MLQHLNDTDWSKCLESTCVDAAWHEFKETFMNIVNTIAPVKEVRLKQRTEPWMTCEILSNIRNRDKLLYSFRKSGDSSTYKEYCTVRNRVQREIKLAKSSYFSEQIEENQNDPKRLWRQLKNLGYSHKQKDSASVVLKIDGEMCFEAKSIADHFNIFFTTVAQKLVEKLPTPTNMYSTLSSVFTNFYSYKIPMGDSLVLQTVSESFVHTELLKLNTSKSTGLDEIPSKFIKEGADIVQFPITHIINLSILTNTVPRDMKTARVRPIFKKNSPLEASNYRPVSILSVVSKILERSVYVQLSDFLERNQLLFEHQSGFRSGFSTDTCLIHLLDYIRGNTSNGLFTGLIMLDLQKAFDTVNHEILCNKLSAMGVISTEWVSSYLTNREQVISVNNQYSDYNHITCGVPQGSILGPLLFLCYVNDMQISIDSDCKLILYADDSAILYAHKDPSHIAAKLGKQLESCSNWLVDNKLSLHLGKTECMLFGPPRKLKNVENFKVKCYDTIIESVTCVKYLGLNIDNFLSGENIVRSIVEKVNARLKFLYRHRKHLDFKCRMTLVSALIQCYFDYSCSSWYAGLSKTLQQKLQVVQNKVVRFILNLGPMSRIDNPMLDKVNMLCVDDRVRQLRLNHVHNIVHNRAPNYLYHNFVSVNEHHNYNTRSRAYNMTQPVAIGKNAGSFYINAVKDWNGLPNNIKGIENKGAFKNAVKIHLLNEAKARFASEYVF